MSKIEFTILAITSSDTKENGFVIVLKEKEGERHLPILVGGFEARAIAMEIERIFTPRPMSHDLMKRLIIEMGGDLFEIQITDLKEDIYFATLVILMDDGTKMKIDARSSDAIALAVRFGCGIYVSSIVLDKMTETLGGSATIPETVEPQEPTKGSPVSNLSLDELKLELEKALAEEDYEKAVAYRDELKKRK